MLLIFTAFPGFIVSFLLPFVSESPRFLLIVKKDEKRATEGTLWIFMRINRVKQEIHIP